MKRMIALALFALMVVATPALADDDEDGIDLTHHVDLLHVNRSGGETKAYDIAYHFTVLEVDRFSFVGAGLGFDMWTECSHPSRCSFDSDYVTVHGSPFLVIPLASIRLTQKSNDGSLSLGGNLVYHFRREDWDWTVGFAITW